MFALEDQPTVDLVGEHHDVAIADSARNLAHVLLGHHAARGILRRVQDDESRTVVDERRELADVEAEIHLFAQRNRDSFTTDEVDHGFIDREAGIGINDLIPLVDQRKHRKEDDGLAAGNDDDFRRIYFYSAAMTCIL